MLKKLKFSYMCIFLFFTTIVVKLEILYVCGMYCLHWKLKLFDVLFTDPCHQDEGGVHHHQDDGEEVIVEAG
jgi:hypothetical protein